MMLVMRLRFQVRRILIDTESTQIYSKRCTKCEGYPQNDCKPLRGDYLLEKSWMETYLNKGAPGVNIRHILKHFSIRLMKLMSIVKSLKLIS